MKDLEIADRASIYRGEVGWTTAILMLATSITMIMVFILCIGGKLPLYLCLPLMSYLLFVVYTPLHEAVHNNISGRNLKLRGFNNGIGYFSGTLLGIPFTMHKAAHLTHHRKTNIAHEDPDFVSCSGFLGVLSVGPRMVWNEWKHYILEIYPRSTIEEKRIVAFELLTLVSWRAALGFWFPVEVIVLTLIANFLAVVLLGYLFAWIVHQPYHDAERYRNTATILLPKLLHTPLTFLWLYQNYHSIHHLFPKVPFYRYRKVFESIRQGMIERGAPIRHASLI